MEGVHIEGKVIELALVVSDWGVGISVELHNRVNKVPYLLIISMEYMCAILVHINPFNVLAINVATQMRALVYHQALLALLSGKMCECGSEETGAYY